MTKFFIQVGMPNATHQQYKQLHSDMRRNGFLRFINSNGTKQQLPAGHCYGTSSETHMQLLHRFRIIAEGIGLSAYITVSDSNKSVECFYWADD